MKKNYSKKSFAVFFVVFSLFIGQINAQKKEPKLNAKPNSLKKKIDKVYKTNQKDLLFKEQLNLKSEDNIVFTKSKKDKLGFTHEKHQQFYNNVKVDFATPIVHSKNGEIKSISGEFYQIENLNTKPSLSEATAFQKAISHIGASSYLWQETKNAKLIKYDKPKGELVILPGYIIDKKENKLAYKFDIYATKPISRGFVYVDAQNGEILFYNAIIKHADNLLGIDFEEYYSKVTKAKSADKLLTAGNAATRYSGTKTIETSSSSGSYILSDITRGNGIKTYDMNEGTNYSSAVDFSDNDNNWTAAEWDNTAKDNGALDAHWGAEMTYDYWQDKHGRNSFDDAGATINSYVHYDTAYDNAFWDGSRMTYGDGSSDGTVGDGYFDILTSLDVAAHEIGHAVCTNTADLAYQKESGAMNEAFSDIWAACVEAYAAPEKDIWLIGEDIERRTTSVALRSMSNPKDEGQPDTYGGTNWVDVNCTPSSSNDYCGVHTNSGVLNHWFYILSEGKSGTNDIGSSYNVTGIGIDKAAQIAFRLESLYLSANSTYAEARTSGIQSAEDLYGADSAEVIATTNAFYAVGVGKEYGDTSIEYCTSAGNSVSDEYIGRVQLGTIDNSTGASSGYTDYTSISTDLVKGDTYTITITPTWTGTVYSEGYSVWIDYNKDGDFDDSEEQVWTNAASKTTPVSGTFTVPTSAITGSTTMRVSMKYNAIPTACESFSYGEVEDYTVVLGTGAPDTEAPTAPTLTSSNITQTTVDLSWSGATDNVGVTGYDVYQGTTLLTSITGTSYQVTNLSADTSYSFTVKAKDEAGNISESSNTVSVTTLAPDTQAPTAPTLTASNTTNTTVDLSWSGATDNVAVTSYDVYQGTSLLTSVTTTTYQVTGLTAATTYSFTIKAKDDAGNVSNTSNAVSVTTLNNQITYCDSKGNNSSYEWIDYVSFGGMTNTTGNDGGYADYTSSVATVAKGTTNEIIISAGFRSSSYTEYWAVWIDFNQDGTFADAEKMVTGSSSSSGNLSADITIPSDAVSGQTRMRVSMKYNSSQTACETFTYGEVEDYTVNISSTTVNYNSSLAFIPSEDLGFEIGSDLNVYPNPTTETIQIKFNKKENLSYKISNRLGQVVKTGKGNKESINISNLKPDVYFLEVNDGQKSIITKIVKE
ncbi:M4 family metallopeptidase [Lutibacter sp. B1]|uniref:M4 family metallopeptidase n=1 Tax=Lutibacter sp. B1 TaxID=2725996 RepID=UPI001456EFD6|nr:M4 family metallopeptidase [Lutibacter sp. B1]NLP57054.1 T9SS type A sorting domain-containing protein [Lutibacter sp. B1]